MSLARSGGRCAYNCARCSSNVSWQRSPITKSRLISSHFFPYKTVMALDAKLVELVTERTGARRRTVDRLRQVLFVDALRAMAQGLPYDHIVAKYDAKPVPKHNGHGVTCDFAFSLKKVGDEGVTLKRCSRCRIALYCSSEHQVQAWKGHKGGCYKYDPVALRLNEGIRLGI